jgi:hypothetical protein
MRTTRKAQWGASLAAAWLACGSALAAGGHHGVDDATILDPGQCELETWLTRDADRANLVHAGGNCRVGPVQLGAAAEHMRRDGAASETAWGLEAKWAREVADGLSVGVLVQPAWQAHVRPRHQGVAAIALATWTPRENLALHLNLGRDVVHQGPDRNRGGVALEWMPARQWSVVAERYLEQDTHFVRAGLRWFGGERWSVDFSRAHRVAGPNPSLWTLGYTRVFGGKD